MKFVTSVAPRFEDAAQDRLRDWFMDIGGGVWMPLLTSNREGRRN